MKKLFGSLLFVVVLVGTLAGCKSASVIPPTTIEKTKIVTTKEVIHDTVFEIKKDSSYLKALLECESGKVVLKSIETRAKGRYLQLPKLHIKDNILTVDCEAKAQKLFAKWKDTYVSEYHQTNISKPVLIKREVTGWQNFEIWCGRIFILLLLLFGVLVFLRWRKII